MRVPDQRQASWEPELELLMFGVRVRAVNIEGGCNDEEMWESPPPDCIKARMRGLRG